MKLTHPEILSPVGNNEMLSAAVRSGADAVYLGLTEFNARRNAGNFDLPALCDAVTYCHIRGVKVYLTLNILLSDKELPDALSLAAKAATTGVDGFIVADIGLCRLLHETDPSLHLHASTQMTVCSPSALPVLKTLGFTRVVAAREMSRDELRAFCSAAKQLNIEVEVFIHGALCMSVSGQCLLSAVLGGRSGNRGLCAGPCRLPFTAEGGTGFDLSLKDLSLLPYLDELSDMGVSSLKIEGRMKRPEYVAAATAATLQMLTAGTVDPLLENSLAAVFSRSGFTDGYYTSQRGKKMFGVRTEADTRETAAALPLLHELYRRERQIVALDGTFIAKSGKPMCLSLCDGDGNSVTSTVCPPEFALHSAATKQSVTENLKKLGGTPYFLNHLTVTLDDGLAIRTALLNELRRNAVEELSHLRAKPAACHTPTSLPEVQLTKKNIRSFVLRAETVAQLPKNLSGVTAVILPATHPVLTLKAKNPDVRFLADLARVPFDEQLVRTCLCQAKENGFCGAVVHNLTEITLCKQTHFPFVFGLGTNIFNSFSAATAADWGAKAILLSPELTTAQIAALKCDIPTCVFAYGRLPLMVFRNCPVKNGNSCEKCHRGSTLCDRKKTFFPIRCADGVSSLYNSRPVWLADRTDEFNADAFLLYFTDESHDRASAVLQSFREKCAPDCEHTRGLTVRGVE